MTDGIETDIKNAGLRDLWKGKTGFTIRADDTEANQATHEEYKTFCKMQCDNNYTQGLRVLLDYVKGDFKYEMIYDKLSEQAATLAELKGSIAQLQSTPKKEDDKSTFQEIYTRGKKYV